MQDFLAPRFTRRGRVVDKGSRDRSLGDGPSPVVRGLGSRQTFDQTRLLLEQGLLVSQVTGSHDDRVRWRQPSGWLGKWYLP